MRGLSLTSRVPVAFVSLQRVKARTTPGVGTPLRPVEEKVEEKGSGVFVVGRRKGVGSLCCGVKEARLKAGITKPASCRTLRHSFAMHRLEDGYLSACGHLLARPAQASAQAGDIRTVQELLGHADVQTTMMTPTC